MFDCFFSTGKDELEISPYDDTLIDSRLASLVAGRLLCQAVFGKVQGTARSTKQVRHFR